MAARHVKIEAPRVFIRKNSVYGRNGCKKQNKIVVVELIHFSNRFNFGTAFVGFLFCSLFGGVSYPKMVRLSRATGYNGLRFTYIYVRATCTAIRLSFACTFTTMTSFGRPTGGKIPLPPRNIAELYRVLPPSPFPAFCPKIFVALLPLTPRVFVLYARRAIRTRHSVERRDSFRYWRRESRFRLCPADIVWLPEIEMTPTAVSAEYSTKDDTRLMLGPTRAATFRTRLFAFFDRCTQAYKLFEYGK